MRDEEWAALPEDEPGELVDGILVEEEEPDCTHEVVVVGLLHALMTWAQPRGGFVAGSGVKYLLRRGRGRKPDVSVFLPGSRPPPRSGLVRRPADLMIEVVSPRPSDVRRDRIAKTVDYAAFGVRWYWLVDPAARTLVIFELGADGRYAFALGASNGRLETIPGCEGLTLDLDALWAEIDRLGPPEADEDEEPSSGE